MATDKPDQQGNYSEENKPTVSNYGFSFTWGFIFTINGFVALKYVSPVKNSLVMIYLFDPTTQIRNASM